MALKTYILLSSIPTGNKPGQTPIKQCSAILENRCQCWNASSFLVKTTRNDKPFEYQLCRRHAMIEQAMPDHEEAVKALDTVSDAAVVKTEEKSASRVVADSTSSFKPAPSKENSTKAIPQSTEAVLEVNPELGNTTPTTKPLLQPKSKPAAF